MFRVDQVDECGRPGPGHGRQHIGSCSKKRPAATKDYQNRRTKESREWKAYAHNGAEALTDEARRQRRLAAIYERGGLVRGTDRVRKSLLAGLFGGNEICRFANVKVEGLDDAFPNCIPFESFIDQHGPHMGSAAFFRLLNGLLYSFNSLCHASTISTKSRMVDKLFVTPAAIAGVHRMAMLDFTKL
jgi:hypothetical protein